MILTPVYYPFHNVVTNNHRKLVKVELDYEDGYFTMNYEAIEKAIVENQVKLFIQCSPPQSSWACVDGGRAGQGAGHLPEAPCAGSK